VTKTYDIAAFARMDAADRKEALGIKATAHLPEYAEPIFVHGIRMGVLDRQSAIDVLGASRNKPQRMVAECPVCGQSYAAGNLAQHHAIHTEAGRAALAAKAKRRADRVAKMRSR